MAAEEALLLCGKGPWALVAEVVLFLAEADVAAECASIAFWRGWGRLEEEGFMLDAVGEEDVGCGGGVGA